MNILNKGIFIIFIFSLLSFSQSKAEKLRTIEISINYATYIYFEEIVEVVETGIREDIDIGFVNNIVKITALTEINYTTNLTITTKTGVYAFFIKYNENPKKLYYKPLDSDIIIRKSVITQTQSKKLKKERQIKKRDINTNIQKNAQKLINKYNLNSQYVRMESKGGVDLYIYPIGIKNNILYFLMRIANFTDIPFEVENIYVSIEGEKKKGKRYVSVPNRLKEIYIHNRPTTILKNTNGSFVFVFKKFTIDKDKRVRVNIYEKGGERNISVLLKPMILYRANHIK